MEILKEYKPGENVIEEGTKGTTAYILLSGAVEIIKKSGNSEITVATLDEGQVFGEMGLIEDRPRSATVRAISDIKVRCINREHFNELLRTKPSVLIPIMKSLFERLRQASDLLAERSLPSGGAQVKEKALKVIMKGQTAEAKKILDDHQLVITKFPFLIGRDSQNPDGDVLDNNDLLIGEQKPYLISRNHMALNNEGGRIWVMDRGSAFGTIVNGREIGGTSGLTRLPLDEPDNQVIIGPVTSKFIFLLKVAAL